MFTYFLLDNIPIKNLNHITTAADVWDNIQLLTKGGKASVLKAFDKEFQMVVCIKEIEET